MAIQINTGFKLTNITTLDDVQPYIKKITKKFTKMADDIWSNIVISDACILYDYDTINNASNDRPYIADAIDAVEDDLVTAFRKRIPTQLDLEILLYFKHIKGKTPCVIGMHNIPNDELRHTFLNLDAVEDFSYYSGGKPHEISKSDWRGRELAWKRTFKDTGQPETSMFSINILKSEPRPVRIDEIQRKIPELEQRARNLGNKIIISELENRREDFNTQEEVFKYLASEEHETRVSAKVNEIKTLLDKSLTTEKLGVTVK